MEEKRDSRRTEIETLRRFVDLYIERRYNDPHYFNDAELELLETQLYAYNGKAWIGVDNSTGECLVEEFPTEELCLKWLNYEIEISDVC